MPGMLDYSLLLKQGHEGKITMRFTLKQLSYFLAAGEANSITLASEKLHISQPSISSAIAQLEAQLGVQLFFRRHAQGLSLTQAGERLLDAARDLLRRAEDLHDIASEITDTISGPLRVGTFKTLAPMILPQLYLDFCEAYPDVDLEFIEGDEADLFSKVRRAELDLAITYEQKDQDLAFEPLALLPTYALVSARHGLARSGSLRLKDLAEQPFILLDLPISRNYFLGLFEQAGLPVNVLARSDQPETIRSMVASGLGYSLLTARPACKVAANGRELAYLHLDDDFPPMKLGIVTNKTIRKTRVVAAFEEHCRRCIDTYAMPGMASL